jgi:hypothetical protein
MAIASAFLAPAGAGFLGVSMTNNSCSLVRLWGHGRKDRLIFGRGRCAIRAAAILPDAKSIPTLFARAKLRRLLDVDDSAWLARVGIEHGHLTREAASQQGACQVMLRVARAHDYELAVKLDAAGQSAW